MNPTDRRRLENQPGFPLYAASREVMKWHKPFLDALGLTYTQYLAMLTLRENRDLNVKALGQFLYLDSGTLTPLLQKLEQRGLVTRERTGADGRNRMLTLTEAGIALVERAKDIPGRILERMPLAEVETAEMQGFLRRILRSEAPRAGDAKHTPRDSARLGRKTATLPGRR